MIGVKYTTARGLAERVVGAIARRLGRRLPASRSARAVLPGAGIADHEALAIETGRSLGLEIPLPAITHLIAKYGEAAAAIIRLTGQRPELREAVAPDSATLGAEIVHTITSEQAVRLADIVIRRTGLGALECPSDLALQTSARVAAAELGWDEARRNEEIEAVRAFYRI